MNTPSDVVAGEVRAIMAKRRMTYEDMSKRCGRDRGWLSRRMRGDQIFTINEIVEVAEVLGVSTRSLLGDLLVEMAS